MFSSSVLPSLPCFPLPCSPPLPSPALPAHHHLPFHVSQCRHSPTHPHSMIASFPTILYDVTRIVGDMRCRCVTNWHHASLSMRCGDVPAQRRVSSLAVGSLITPLHLFIVTESYSNHSSPSLLRCLLILQAHLPLDAIVGFGVKMRWEFYIDTLCL